MRHDELDLLRAFRSEVPDPDRETATRIYRLATADSRARRRSFIVRPLVLLCVAVVAGAAAASIVTAPWHGGPTVLDRASAAITAPTAAQVLYERATFSSPTIVGYHYPLVRLTHMARAGDGWFELWVQGGRGKRTFRSVTGDIVPNFPGGVLAPSAPWGNGLTRLPPGPHTTEVGGFLGPQHVLEADVYQPDGNRIVRYTQAPTAINSTSFDPAALIRHALADRQAHDAGTTTVHGRRVERIDLTIHDLDNGNGSATYYVDASTYRPVEIVFHRAVGIRYPDLPIFQSNAKSNVVFRFTDFRYLPATPANVALASIGAQHPQATTICGEEFGLPDC